MKQLFSKKLILTLLLINFCSPLYCPPLWGHGGSSDVTDCCCPFYFIFEFLCFDKPPSFDEKPVIFTDIGTNDISLVIDTVTKNPHSIHDFYKGRTPLQYALETGKEKIFTYLLAQNSCTQINNSNILSLIASEGKYLPYLKIILASGKLYNIQHIHSINLHLPLLNNVARVLGYSKYITDSDQNSIQLDPTHDAWTKMIRGATPCIVLTERHSTLPSGYYTSYTEEQLYEASQLLFCASLTKESLYQKYLQGGLYKNDPQLENWVKNNFPMNQEAKEFMDILVTCPLHAEDFEKMVHNHIFTLADFAKLQEKHFAYSLIARNSETIMILVNKLIQNQEYEPAQSLIKKFDTALKNHLDIWEPYAKEITAMKTKIEKMYKRQQEIAYALLTKQSDKDLFFKFN